MNLRKYFKLVSALPTPEKPGLSALATAEANKLSRGCCRAQKLLSGQLVQRESTRRYSPPKIVPKLASTLLKIGIQEHCIAESTVQL